MRIRLKAGRSVAKYLSEARSLVACTSSLRVATLDGSRDYVPMDTRWRYGSRMTLPHSTQRTLPASCSSSVTRSEIRRLCVQMRRGLIGKSVRFLLILCGSRCTYETANTIASGFALSSFSCPRDVRHGKASVFDVWKLACPANRKGITIDQLVQLGVFIYV